MEISTTDLPESISRHLREVAESFGLDSGEDTIARLGASWMEKNDVFETSMIDMGMDEIPVFDREDERGALALTYSGSLVSIGPLVDGKRKIDYTSIGFRNDVPPSVSRDDCVLAEDAAIDNVMVFERGPIKKTSPLYRIVACPASLSADEQEELIDDATTVIIDTFVGMNRELLGEE